MGAQVLIIPALFVVICGSFIIFHSWYYRWKISGAFKKKREAAKISLVNILQMTNPTLITPSWISNGSPNSSKERSKHYMVFHGSKSPSVLEFDPRNPNVLASDMRLAVDYPPPCYEDLFGDKEDFVRILEYNGTSHRAETKPEALSSKIEMESEDPKLHLNNHSRDSNSDQESEHQPHNSMWTAELNNPNVVLHL